MDEKQALINQLRLKINELGGHKRGLEIAIDETQDTIEYLDLVIHAHKEELRELEDG